MALYSNNRYIISSRVRCKKLSELEFVSSIIILYLPLTNNIYSILLLLIHLTAPIKARFGFLCFFFSLFLIFLPEKNFSHIIGHILWFSFSTLKYISEKTLV